MFIARNVVINPDVALKFKAYPQNIQAPLFAVRSLIFEVAEQHKLGDISENLKWGQASYSAKKGSPIRLGWDQQTPQYISVFFHCQTKLVATFKEIFHSSFKFVGNRQLLISTTETLPTSQLTACISMALRYHSIKHLPLLGA
ncbi:DUF1801 domain-containing protein [Paraglaciecola aquimarina]|uniref:DUF1801 domain-containing protein n=1 Tax=Paraglaciecola aquimarina TaxID=1235557 RepID=A0ABU3SZ05_9ALTE|nr:DUF1801 domain-containing protein [Paraglaciecola aquimarina]MDU0355237.1 DUF1801 domain-containing protein [Paraglaciecola aquimarina]